MIKHYLWSGILFWILSWSPLFVLFSFELTGIVSIGTMSISELFESAKIKNNYLWKTDDKQFDEYKTYCLV